MRRTSYIPRCLVVVVTLVLLLLAACEPPLSTPHIQALPTDTSAPTLTPPPATPTLSPSGEKEEKVAVPTISAQDSVTVEPGAERAVAGAQADLMHRLDVTEDDVFVKSVEEKQWRDTSLGCPQPGMMYAQVITPGFRVLLEVEGQTYEYHTDRGRVVMLCDEEVGLAVGPVSPTQVIQEVTVAVSPTIAMPSSPALQELVRQAKEDLALRLSLKADEVDQIDLVEVKAVVWPDSSLGCPQPGMAYIQVPRDGLLVRLRVG